MGAGTSSHTDEPNGEERRPSPVAGGERPRARPAKVRRWSGIERALRGEYGPLLAGVDEVGRGPLAGPVVACAVVMPPDARAIRGVDDSKQLTRAERERLACADSLAGAGSGAGCRFSPRDRSPQRLSGHRARYAPRVIATVGDAAPRRGRWAPAAHPRHRAPSGRWWRWALLLDRLCLHRGQGDT